MANATDIEPVTGPGLWSADELTARDDWVIRPDSAALDDISAALAGVKRRGISLKDITAEDFPLPAMAGDLAAVRALLTDGPGVCLMRGLPVDAWDQDDLEVILWGIGAHVGCAVEQSYRGDVIGEVMDMSHTGDARRAYRSPRPLHLHTDSADVAGLLCLRQAKSGGMSLAVSSAAVHNAILAERPDLMPALYRGYHYRSSEASSIGVPPTSAHRIPVFAEAGGRLVCYFNAFAIGRSLAEDDIENDAAALEAFELFKAVSARDALLYRSMLEPGDLQFLNNRTVMHGRTAFEDYGELERKRLLLRVWLKMPDWADPPAHMLYNRDRGRERTAGVEA